MTSVLNLTGFILSAWILASFIIILNGFVLTNKINTYEFCVLTKRMRNSRLHFTNNSVRYRPCWGLLHNGNLPCYIRCSLFSGQGSFFLQSLLKISKIFLFKLYKMQSIFIFAKIVSFIKGIGNRILYWSILLIY